MLQLCDARPKATRRLSRKANLVPNWGLTAGTARWLGHEKASLGLPTQKAMPGQRKPRPFPWAGQPGTEAIDLGEQPEEQTGSSIHLATLKRFCVTQHQDFTALRPTKTRQRRPKKESSVVVEADIS